MRRRHRDDVGPHRARAADTDRDGAGVVVRAGPFQLRLRNRVEGREQCIGLQSEVNVDVVAIEQLALHRHQACSHLGVTDVDRQDDVARVSQLDEPSRSG